MKEFLSVIVGLISEIISAVITYFATRSKVRLDLTAEYDKNSAPNGSTPTNFYGRN